MSQACTIYSPRDFQEVYDFLESTDIVEVPDADTVSFEKTYVEGNLKIALKRQIERGDSFSSLLRGTWNYFDTISTDHTEQKNQLTNRILETNTAIGIVADPEFNDEDERLDLVFKLSELFDGVIFNGSMMLNKDGQVILDSEGNSDL